LEIHYFYITFVELFGINLNLTYMKTLKFILGTLAVAAVSMIATPAVNAQEDGNRDENGKVVRGPYLTNQFGDNWFVNVGGGVNIAYDNADWALGGAVNVNAGKWITPSVGARVGFNGITGMDGRFGYIHADALWNISNAIGGYKETRLWDFVPYLHAGFLYDRPIAGREWGAGAGLLNLVRLTDRLDLTLDVRGNIYRRYCRAGYISVAVGLSVNLGKTNFVRAANWHNPEDVAALDAAAASAAALAAANAALEAENGDLKKANEELAGNLEKAIAEKDANVGLKEVGPAAFYFEIGKTTLSQKELEHLDFYLKNVLPNVKGKSVTVITGSADKKTGSAKRNQYLCEKRAEYLKNLMVEKYGIDASAFDVKTNIATEGDASLSRAVVVSFE
jgi:outer membrane protein OmpA-like peptidoglycan-associated protein